MIYAVTTDDLVWVTCAGSAQEARERVIDLIRREYEGPIVDERIEAVRAGKVRSAVDAVRFIRTFPIVDMDMF